jgi:hypothetical protein
VASTAQLSSSHINDIKHLAVALFENEIFTRLKPASKKLFAIFTHHTPVNCSGGETERLREREIEGERALEKAGM